ncbi:jg8418 [Pararge aegeria aegeria]|uniref:Jg8418 protein n=2 Tax=Pararge aegeria TaxID=116150 RepID=A0A8S4SKW4_9NEOP|nr:jg8418 [Pararge aegeria aegeria]
MICGNEGCKIVTTKYHIQLLTVTGTIAVWNNYTFSKHYVVKDGFRWKCSKQFSQSCRAFLVLDDSGMVMRSYSDHNHEPTGLRYYANHLFRVKGRSGKDILMLNGYTYYQHKILRDGFRWSCTRMGSRSCKGFLHVTNDMVKLDIIIQTAEITIFILEFYLRPNGRINLRLNNFTFYKHLKARSNAHRWSCTAYGSKWKCKAHLIITDKLEVLKANVAHSHPPSTKKDARNQIKPIHPIWNGTGNKENGTPIRSSQPPSLTPLHDYLVAHSVFSNYE